MSAAAGAASVDQGEEGPVQEARDAQATRLEELRDGEEGDDDSAEKKGEDDDSAEDSVGDGSSNLSPKEALGSAKTLKGLSLISSKELLDNQIKNWDISRVFVERYKRINSNGTMYQWYKCNGTN